MKQFTMTTQRFNAVLHGAWAACLAIAWAAMLPAPTMANPATAKADNAAVQALSLSKKYACTACHATTERVVGPSFQEIAKRYAGKSDAPAALANSLRKGVTGNWGKTPMPANADLTDAEANILVAWVLATP